MSQDAIRDSAASDPGSAREYVYGYLHWMWPLRDDPLMRQSIRYLLHLWREMGRP